MATTYLRRKVRIDPSDRTRPGMTKPELWSVCANSGCDPRTLKKVWEGELVQESSGFRAWAALKAAGLLRADAKKPQIPEQPKTQAEPAAKNPLPVAPAGA